MNMRRYVVLALLGVLLSGCVVHATRGGYARGHGYGYGKSGWADRGHHHHHQSRHHHWRR